MTRSRLLAGRRALVSVALVVLGGCGFRPLYMPQGGAAGPQRDLGSIDVALIPDRPGQLLRQALQQRLDRGEGLPKRYTLNVSFGIAGDALAIQRDSTATRLRQVATATWTLKSLDPERTTVTNGVARALDGVNVIDQQYFAADLEGQTATKRLADTVADQITLQIASFFARRATTA